MDANLPVVVEATAAAAEVGGGDSPNNARSAQQILLKAAINDIATCPNAFLPEAQKEAYKADLEKGFNRLLTVERKEWAAFVRAKELDRGVSLMLKTCSNRLVGIINQADEETPLIRELKTINRIIGTYVGELDSSAIDLTIHGHGKERAYQELLDVASGIMAHVRPHQNINELITELQAEQNGIWAQANVSSTTCKVCLVNVLTYVATPCGHPCVCQSCMGTLDIKKGCIVCRREIAYFQRIYV